MMVKHTAIHTSYVCRWQQFCH